MIWERKPIDSRRAAAQRAIRETEVFLADCLRHPESVRRIPAVRVGFGRFPKGLAEEFWNSVLGTA
ncbi:MAG: hypothetical protein DHS20C16_25710 [Phycisphaerae bacterium]|nr:MAG: hypothetical protein DHS20C16_25710 [Phycisphaerae bacterium]